MTDETPKRAKESNPMFCDDCNCAVRLERNTMGELTLRCACGTERTIVDIATLPEGWTDE